MYVMGRFRVIEIFSLELISRGLSVNAELLQENIKFYSNLCDENSLKLLKKLKEMKRSVAADCWCVRHDTFLIDFGAGVMLLEIWMVFRKKTQDAVTEGTGLRMKILAHKCVLTNEKKMIEDPICHNLIEDVKRRAIIPC